MIIYRLFNKLWRSPSFTQFLLKLIQPLRLVLITPLILTRFSEVEIAAWYIFASISFLSTILMTRLGMTFERMVSMALGGKSDLSPIKKIESRVEPVEENWEGIIKVYRCLATLNIGVVVASVSVSSLIGYFTLNNVISANESGAGDIWITFIFIMGSQLALGGFQFFANTLRGLNHVALLNRWQVVFNIFSVIGGVIVLSLNGGMLQLAMVMQGVLFLGVIRNAVLIRLVNQQKLRGQLKPHWDSEVWQWAKIPLWKGFIGQFSTQGISHMSALILATYSSTANLNAFLISLTVLRALQQFSMVPFISQMPYFTLLLSEGKQHKLKKLTNQRLVMAQAIFVIGVLTIGIFGPMMLDLIGSSATMLPTLPWLVLSLVFLHERFNTYNLAICGLGNHIAMYWQQALAGGLSLLLMWFTIPQFGSWGVILSLAFPPILVLKLTPARYACEQLAISLKQWLPTTMCAHIVLIFSVILTIIANNI